MEREPGGMYIPWKYELSTETTKITISMRASDYLQERWGIGCMAIRIENPELLFLGGAIQDPDYPLSVPVWGGSESKAVPFVTIGDDSYKLEWNT